MKMIMAGKAIRWITVVAILASMAACNSAATSTQSSGSALTHAPAVAEVAGQPNLIAASITKWPAQTHRSFFATIHALGNRITASGVLNARSPYDFRLTAVTETGNVLFDTRKDWAGEHTDRILPGLPEYVPTTITHDVSMSLRLPANLNGLSKGKTTSTLKVKAGDNVPFVYTFDNATGRLLEMQVDLGTFDKLHIKVDAYDAAGQPKQISMSRPSRGYNMTMTLTDTWPTTQKKD